jgi:SAM-dependent methyltransferase
VSEIAAMRDVFPAYCKGFGADFGCGAQKVCEGAVGVDFAMPYQNPTHPEGKTAADFVGPWEEFVATLPEGSLDYIASSHLLEDYEDPAGVLLAWRRYLKVGGLLLLVLPNELQYRLHCIRAGSERNFGHRNWFDGHEDFIGRVLAQAGAWEVLEAGDSFPYSFYVVARKTGA